MGNGARQRQVACHGACDMGMGLACAIVWPCREGLGDESPYEYLLT